MHQVLSMLRQWMMCDCLCRINFQPKKSSRKRKLEKSDLHTQQLQENKKQVETNAADKGTEKLDRHETNAADDGTEKLDRQHQET